MGNNETPKENTNEKKIIKEEKIETHTYSKEEKKENNINYIINKKEKNFNNISIINHQEKEKNNPSQNFFINNKKKKLTEKLKDKIEKSSKSNKRFFEKKKDLNSNKESKSKNNQKKNINLKEDIIILKDNLILNEIEQVSEIEKYLEQIKEYEVKGNKTNELNFKEIEQDDIINFNDESVLNFFKSINFFLSENSKKKLNLLFFCIKHGFNIIISGPTGSGKTYLIEAICNFLKKNLIKYNYVENSKFPNLKFSCEGDNNELERINYIKRPLLKTLTNKNTLFLLDNADLAPIEVLQTLDAMIGCGYLVYEDKGKLVKIDAPKDFCCIFTLNSRKGKFSGTRQELPKSFKNKFISIEFPEMKKEELYAITEGVSKAFELEKIIDNYQQFIDDFISFHMEWSKNEKIQDDAACLVIRDILAVLNIIAKGEDPTETIMNIYGARYTEKIKLEMKEVLYRYYSFKNYKENYDNIKEEFPKSYYINKNTLELISTCIFSLKYGRYPIIAGNSGSGKKFLAFKLADYFNEYIAEKNIESNSNIINLSENSNEKSNNENLTMFIVYCSKYSKVEDFIGKAIISKNKGGDLMQWQDGPLIKAIKKGKPLILIGIHELKPTILEYINELLDIKYDRNKRYLNNPNNPNEPLIEIHNNFRLICTALLSEMNKLSPSFVTRMDLKILNNQLEKITEKELFSLIKTCMNNVKSELSIYEEDKQKKLKELKEELQMSQSRQNLCLINDSSTKSLSFSKNNKTEKSQNSSADSNNSLHLKKSINSITSNKSKSSFDSDESKKNNKRKNSNNSADSKNSNESKDSKQSNNSKSSKKSFVSQDPSQNESEDEFSNFRKKRRKSSSYSDEKNENNDSDEELDNDIKSEEQYEDIIKEKIEFLENKENENFNENKINEIINNNEIFLEIKKFYEAYNEKKNIKMNMSNLEKFIRSTILMIYKLSISNEVDNKIIIKLVYDLLFSEKPLVTIDDKFKRYILTEKLNHDPLNQYFFIGIPKLENYMISLYLYSIINIPIS